MCQAFGHELYVFVDESWKGKDMMARMSLPLRKELTTDLFIEGFNTFCRSLDAKLGKDRMSEHISKVSKIRVASPSFIAKC